VTLRAALIMSEGEVIAFERGEIELCELSGRLMSYEVLKGK
jgi:hypothetical protein